MDPKSLPCTLQNRGPRLFGVTSVTCGLVITILFGYAFFYVVFEDPARAVFGIVPLVIGLVLTFAGLRSFYREKMILTSKEVSYTKQSFFRKIEFKESLNQYRGILRQIHLKKAPGFGHPTILYSIELSHTDPKKTVTLWKSHQKKLFVETWEHYAKLLKLPAIQKAEKNQFFARHYQDLDKSLRELILEGKIKTTGESLHSPFLKKTLQIHEGIYGTEIVKRFKIAPLQKVLRLGPSELQIEFQIFGVLLKTITLPYQEIKEVFIGYRDTAPTLYKSDNTLLKISSSREIVYFGEGSTEQEKKWLQDFVSEKIRAA